MSSLNEDTDVSCFLMEHVYSILSKEVESTEELAQIIVDLNQYTCTLKDIIEIDREFVVEWMYRTAYHELTLHHELSEEAANYHAAVLELAEVDHDIQDLIRVALYLKGNGEDFATVLADDDIGDAMDLYLDDSEEVMDLYTMMANCGLLLDEEELLELMVRSGKEEVKESENGESEEDITEVKDMVETVKDESKFEKELDEVSAKLDALKSKIRTMIDAGTPRAEVEDRFSEGLGEIGAKLTALYSEFETTTEEPVMAEVVEEPAMAEGG